MNCLGAQNFTPGAMFDSQQPSKFCWPKGVSPMYPAQSDSTWHSLVCSTWAPRSTPAGQEVSVPQEALAPVAIGAASPWPSAKWAVAQQLGIAVGQSSGPSHISSAPPSPQVPGVT